MSYATGYYSYTSRSTILKARTKTREMKKILIFTISIIGLLSCQEKKTDLTCERIDYLVKTKQSVAKQYWADFNRETLFGPMLYYTKNGLYTLNANDKLKEKISIIPYSCNNSDITIGFSQKIDTTNLYMYVSYDHSDTLALEYKNTLGMFSDVELIEKFIPDVKDTEEWMSMVIHEMFHQYQRKFKKFRKKQLSSQSEFKRDTLNYFYKNQDWFNKSVKLENKTLLKIIEENNRDSIKNYISKYLKDKNKRISRIKSEFKIDISELENSLSKSEGTGRYIEYCVKLHFKTSNNNQTLLEIDNKYVADRFKDYNIEQDNWMYNLGGGYYYSIGFNLTRVLEKLKINYQESIFLDNKSFDQFLKEYSE